MPICCSFGCGNDLLFLIISHGLRVRAVPVFATDDTEENSHCRFIECVCIDYYQLLKARIAANLLPIREKNTKKATKMVGIFVLILGVSELPIH